MNRELSKQINRVAWISAVVAWLAWGFPLFKHYMLGDTIRDYPIAPQLFVPYVIFGALMMVTMAVRLRPALLWAALSAQLAAVVAMVLILPWAGISQFLVIVAWQAAVSTTPRRALAWTSFQTLAVIAAMSQSMTPDLCWVFVKSFALQLLLVFMARALRRESETSRALAQTNRELRSAQAIIANSVRDAERTRISRELHDAWGHELTALRLQLEIASHVDDADKVSTHVRNAKGLSSDLLAKVRDVVATLRQAERSDLKNALQELAQSVPTPAVHVAVAGDIAVNPDQAHALIRCSQEAITNAVKHSDAANLWLEVAPDSGGVRLIARNDGSARAATAPPGSGLRGMRERIEALGGRLTVAASKELGFTIDAWLPTAAPKLA